MVYTGESYKPKPHALYSLRVASLPYGRQGCGLNPIPTPCKRVEPQANARSACSREGQGLRSTHTHKNANDCTPCKRVEPHVNARITFRNRI